MIDAHAHLLERPAAGAAEAWVLPGVEPERDARSAALAAADPRLHAAAGLHPWYLPDEASLPAALERVARAAESGAVAIGETGLDRGRRGGPMPLQRLAFTAQLRLARRLRLPLILHVVRSHGACLAAIAEVDAGLPEPPPALRGMVHDFGGPAEVVPDWVRAGFFLSVSPRGLNRPAAIRAVPGERLLVETDDEGPERLREVVREVAAIRGVLEEDVAAVTAANARRLFGLRG